MKKRHIELTQSRARQANDNALVESKNGSIVRTHLGYSHIRQHWAPLVNPFHQEYLNPYINDQRNTIALAITDNEAAKRLKDTKNNALKPLLDRIRPHSEACRVVMHCCRSVSFLYWNILMCACGCFER